MPISATIVTGPLYSPGLVALTDAKIIFDLTSWDSNPGDNVFVTGPYVADIDITGNFEVTLFTNTDGINQTIYDVYVSYLDENNQQNLYDPRIKKFIGQVSLSGSGPISIADLDLTSEHSAGSFDLYSAMSNLVASGENTQAIVEADRIAAEAAAEAVKTYTETDAEMSVVTVADNVQLISRLPTTLSVDQVAPINQLSFWRRELGATVDPYFITAGPVTWVQTGVREDEILSIFTSGISGVFNNPEIAGLKPFANYAAFLAASISSVVDRVMWYDGTDIVTVTRDPAQSGGTVAQTDGTLWYPETIDVAGGSAAAPSITFYGDNNTGLYNAAANQIGFATTGTLRALLSGTALELSVPLKSSSARLTIDAPITVPTNEASSVSDLSFQSNAVIGSEQSLTLSMKTGGYWRWMKDATTAEGGTAGGTEIARLDDAAFNIDVPITGTAAQSSKIDDSAGVLLRIGAFGLGSTAITLTASDDLDAVTATGFYFNNTGSNTPGNNYPISSAGSLLNIRRSTNNWTQEFTSYSADSSTTLMRKYCRSYGGLGWTPWSEIFHQGSILDTVSQTAGVPTGGLIERGSNADGEYVKFADGTLICTHRLSMGSITAVGDGTRYSPYRTTVTTWTFPAVFATYPNVFGDAFNPDTLASDIACSLNNQVAPNTTRALLLAVRNTDDGTASTMTDLVNAIGRWF